MCVFESLIVIVVCMDEDVVKDQLVEKAKRVLDDQLTSREKVERKALSDKGKGGVWSKEEIDFLKNNRNGMSNEELEDFFVSNEYSDEDWAPFSRTEERYILQSYGTSDLETIAEGLDRTVEEVKKKVKMMGLEI